MSGRGCSMLISKAAYNLGFRVYGLGFRVYLCDALPHPGEVGAGDGCDGAVEGDAVGDDPDPALACSFLTSGKAPEQLRYDSDFHQTVTVTCDSRVQQPGLAS